ncbi:MAG: BT4734/BF3469 family protein [Salinivirgaceae bacterium]|nr:BT4734/BF3469 family protein [Salinivirgaceae bacterium]
MEARSKEAILSKTHYGIGIYAHILRLYYPDQTVLSLSGRTCSPTKNPFNADKSTLNIYIKKENVLGNALDKEFARHSDSQNAIPAGDAFDFAELRYKQSGEELLQTLNKEMNLHIGEKFDFYTNGKKSNKTPEAAQTQSPSIGGVGEAFFSFFKAPVQNIIPHKSISLLDAYNYIVGEYAKQRTEKLRSIKEPKQARQFKANNFDYCTFSGVFTSRNDKKIVQHSGLMAVDFDHLPNLEEVRQSLLVDEYFDTQLLFVSPSGDGLKWIISIDTKQTTHSNYFAAVANYILQTYGIEVDKSGRDISRACFLPHDPNAFINPLILENHDTL